MGFLRNIIIMAALAWLPAGMTASAQENDITIGTLAGGTVMWELQAMRDLGIDRQNGFRLRSTELAGNPATQVAMQGGAIQIPSGAGAVHREDRIGVRQGHDLPPVCQERVVALLPARNGQPEVHRHDPRSARRHRLGQRHAHANAFVFVRRRGGRAVHAHVHDDAPGVFRGAVEAFAQKRRPEFHGR